MNELLISLFLNDNCAHLLYKELQTGEHVYCQTYLKHNIKMSNAFGANVSDTIKQILNIQDATQSQILHVYEKLLNTFEESKIKVQKKNLNEYVHSNVLYDEEPAKITELSHIRINLSSNVIEITTKDMLDNWIIDSDAKMNKIINTPTILGIWINRLSENEQVTKIKLQKKIAPLRYCHDKHLKNKRWHLCSIVCLNHKNIYACFKCGNEWVCTNNADGTTGNTSQMSYAKISLSDKIITSKIQHECFFLIYSHFG